MILGAFHGWPGSKGMIVGRMAIVQRRLVGRIVTGKDLIISFLIRGLKGGGRSGGGFVSPSHSYIYIFFLYD